jgi:hypothetical protein
MKIKTVHAWVFEHERPVCTIAQLKEGVQLPVQPDLFCVAPMFSVDLHANSEVGDHPFSVAHPSYSGMFADTIPFLQPLAYIPDRRSTMLYCSPAVLDRTSLYLGYNHRQSFNTPHDKQVFEYVTNTQKSTKRSLELAIILGDL